jgi:16S rRNA G966 N2-methylase RsmD
MSKKLDDALKVIEEELGVKIRTRKLTELKPDPENARKHSDRNRGIIAESIKEVGAGRSVVVDGNDVTRAGNATIAVAQSIGMTEAIQVETTGDRLLVHKRADVKDARKAKRLALQDNAATDASEWDTDRLVADMKEDGTILTGIFDEDDDILHRVRRALAEKAEQSDEDFDGTPPEPGKTVTQRGDVWVCGTHRVMCGDATDPVELQMLLDGKKPQFVYADPPYGISVVQKGQMGGGGAFGGVANEIRGQKRIEPNRYAPIIGDDTIETAVKAFNACAALKPRSSVWWGANHYAAALPNSACWIVWDKETTGNFADAELAWTNKDLAVRLFTHKWNGLVKDSERGEKRIHPTQKPVALAAWCLEKFGEGGDLVLDPFGGSGSTLIACESLQRRAFLMELSAPYCDVIVSRWEHSTGKKATRIPAVQR